MSWTEVKVLNDKLTSLANATIHLNIGTDFANKTVMLKRYDSDYMNVELDSQGTAEVEVTPKSRYEAVTNDEDDSRTSNVFYVEAGAYKDVYLDMSANDGDTAVPINNVKLWLMCADIYDTYQYSTVDEVMADSACMALLFNSDNANKYLARSTEIFTSLIADDTVLTLMGSIQKIRNKIATTQALTDIVGTLGYVNRIKIFKHRSTIFNSETDTTDASAGGITSFANGDTASQDFATNATKTPKYMYDGTMTNSLTTVSSASQINAEHSYFYTFNNAMILKGIRFCSNAGEMGTIDQRTLHIYAYDEESLEWVLLADGLTSATINISVDTSCSNNIKSYYKYKIIVEGNEVRNGSGYRMYGCGELEWYGVKPNIA